MPTTPSAPSPPPFAITALATIVPASGAGAHDQDLTTDDDRPALFETYPFDGPMPGHEPGMPVHYDLHVWLYDHNPAGQLAAWNPTVAC